MQSDTDLFCAEFPGPFQVNTKEDEGAFGTESQEHICVIDGDIGVFSVKVTRTKNDLWSQVPSLKRQTLAATMAKVFGDALVERLAKPGFLRKPKFTLDEVIEADQGAMRRLSFSFKRDGMPAFCFAEVLVHEGLVYESFAVTAPDPAGSARGIAFLESVKIKALDGSTG